MNENHRVRESYWGVGAKKKLIKKQILEKIDMKKDNSALNDALHIIMPNMFKLKV